MTEQYQPQTAARPSNKKRVVLQLLLLAIVIIGAAAFWKRNAIKRMLNERMPVSSLEDRVRENPNDVAAAETMTKRLLAEGGAAEAFRVLREATSKGDAPGDVWLCRARAAHRAGDDIDAARSAATALKSTKHPANAHWILGMTQLGAGNEDGAQSEFKKVTELDPKFGQAWVQLGTYSLKYTLHGPALEQFQHALDASPHDATASAGLADALYAMSKYDEAEKHARDAVEWKPDAPEGHLSLARILAAKNGDAATIELEFKEALRLSPGSAVVQQYLASYYLQKNDAQKALETLQQAIQIRPFQKECYPLLVRAYRLLNKPADAQKAQDKYKQLETMETELRPLEQKVWSSPEDAKLRIQLVNAYLARGRTDLAKHQAEQLRRLAPDSPEVKALLARMPASAKSAPQPAAKSNSFGGQE